MEYLAPGVFIEETSYRTRSIEGVSTSTAGFVGRAQDGPDNEPTLVTSFADFVRIFGAPQTTRPLNPATGDMLGYAVEGFFANGGRRAWIVRVLGPGARQAEVRGYRGVALRLRHSIRGGSTLPLDVQWGITVAPTATDVVITYRLAGDATIHTQTGEVHSYDPIRGTVTLTAALPPTVFLHPDRTVVTLDANPQVQTGAPTFTAKYSGEAGNRLSVLVRPSNHPRLGATVGTPTTRIVPARDAGFYADAIIELDNGTRREVRTVTAVGSGGELTIPTAFPGTAAGDSLHIRLLEVDLIVFRDGVLAETFRNLSWNPALVGDSRHYADAVNDPDTGSDLITVTPGAGGTDVHDAPLTSYGLPQQLEDGSGGGGPSDTELAGTDGGPGLRTGIEALIEREDISIVAVPGVTSDYVQARLITHCETMRYRVAILDSPDGVHEIPALESNRGVHDSTHASYYAPWLKTRSSQDGSVVTIPPSGHVAGIWARTDNERGVHKAPANEVVRGITDLDVHFTTGEQEILNPFGINLIRRFDRRGIRVWGARTISSDSDWKYLSTRRYFAYLEASIERSTGWVVFEPNGQLTWDRVRQSVESFLTSEWKEGRLAGTTEDKAFFVRCDRRTMTQNDIDNGRLICEIGVAPLYPAEFVIFRIGQWTGDST